MTGGGGHSSGRMGAVGAGRRGANGERALSGASASNNRAQLIVPGRELFGGGRAGGAGGRAGERRRGGGGGNLPFVAWGCPAGAEGRGEAGGGRWRVVASPAAP